MFRHLTTALLALLAGNAAASGLERQPQPRSVGSIADYAAQAVQDHLQSQLDWRSYYLDRSPRGQEYHATGADGRTRHPLVYGE